MFKEVEMPNQLTGTIYSWTVVRQAPEGYEHLAPYVMALVDVNESGGGMGRLLMRITDLDPNKMDPEGVESQVSIDDRVEIVTRKKGGEGERGVLSYIYAARHPIDWEKRR